MDGRSRRSQMSFEGEEPASGRGSNMSSRARQEPTSKLVDMNFTQEKESWQRNQKKGSMPAGLNYDSAGSTNYASAFEKTTTHMGVDHSFDVSANTTNNMRPLSKVSKQTVIGIAPMNDMNNSPV